MGTALSAPLHRHQPRSPRGSSCSPTEAAWVPHQAARDAALLQSLGTRLAGWALVIPGIIKVVEVVSLQPAISGDLQVLLE